MNDEEDVPEGKRQKSKALLPASGLHERYAKLVNPPYLEKLASLANPPWREQLDMITNLSHMSQWREQIASLVNPPWKEQLASIINFSQMSQWRDQLALIANPPWKEQLAVITGPSQLSQWREEVAALVNPPWREQLAALTSSLPGTQWSEQIAALTKSSHLSQIREQLTAITNPPFISQMRQQLTDVPGGKRLQVEMASVLDSYDGLLQSSALANFLFSPEGGERPLTQHVGVEGFDSLQLGDLSSLEIDQSADRAIVEAISGGEAANLSPPMMQRLIQVYMSFLIVWDMFIRIMDTYAAYLALTAALSGVSAPAEISKQAGSLPGYERQLLADYRIVNRNGAKLRAEPSKASDVIVSLPFGLPVEVLKKSDSGWFYVSAEYNGDFIEGWMYITVTTAVPPPKKFREQSANAGRE